MRRAPTVDDEAAARDYMWSLVLKTRVIRDRARHVTAQAHLLAAAYRRRRPETQATIRHSRALIRKTHWLVQSGRPLPYLVDSRRR